jgi:hypothetical protein
MIKEIDREVPDSESDGAAAKGSTAAKSLIPRDEFVKTNLKPDDEKKKAKEKKAWMHQRLDCCLFG